MPSNHSIFQTNTSTQSNRNPISAKLVKISQISVTENRTPTTTDTQSSATLEVKIFVPHLQSRLQIKLLDPLQRNKELQKILKQLTPSKRKALTSRVVP